MTVKDFDDGVDISILRSKFKEATAVGDSERMLIWAGAGVGLINSLLPARVSLLFSIITTSAYYQCVVNECFVNSGCRTTPS